MAKRYSKRAYEFRSALPSPLSCCGPGIYAILNQANFKIYIGSSLRLNHRWTEHRCELEENEHGNRYLQRAFNSDPNAFVLELIEELPRGVSREQLLAREQFWMDFYRSHNPAFGYNISPKAESCQGIKRTPEQRAHLSKIMTGRPVSQKTRLKLSKANGGKIRKPHSPQTIEKMRRAVRPVSTTEAKAKMSASHRANPSWQTPVLQFDLNGNFIRRWEQIEHAKQHIAGLHDNVSSACAGRQKTAGGFIWRYAEPERKHG